MRLSISSLMVVLAFVCVISGAEIAATYEDWPTAIARLILGLMLAAAALHIRDGGNSDPNCPGRV